ncbi:MAG: hypothetical protein WC589_01580 [Sphingobacterium sp.]
MKFKISNSRLNSLLLNAPVFWGEVSFSEFNLRNMWYFYQTFPDLDRFSTQRVENLQSVTHRVTNLSWTIIQRIY